MINTQGMSDFEDLSALIAVNPNATVSSTPLKAEGVNVVLFSFDEGEELSEHTAAMPVIVQVLEGELLVQADGRDVTLRPGGLVHFTTRLPHAIKAMKPSKMLLLMLARPERKEEK